MPLIYFNIRTEILAKLQMQKIFICIFALKFITSGNKIDYYEKT